MFSLHIEKCFGTSFGSALMDAYGSRFRLLYRCGSCGKYQICTDYDYEVLECDHHVSFEEVLEEYSGTDAVIHGHVFKEELKLVPIGAYVVTWLREPAARLLSHYYHDKKTVKDLQMEDFFMANRNYITERIGAGFLWRVDFVGIMEKMDSHISIFEKLKGVTLNLERHNEGDYEVNEEELKLAAEYVTADQKIYERHSRLRK